MTLKDNLRCFVSTSSYWKRKRNETKQNSHRVRKKVRIEEILEQNLLGAVVSGSDIR